MVRPGSNSWCGWLAFDCMLADLLHSRSHIYLDFFLFSVGYPFNDTTAVMDASENKKYIITSYFSISFRLEKSSMDRLETCQRFSYIQTVQIQFCLDESVTLVKLDAV